MVIPKIVKNGDIVGQPFPGAQAGSGWMKRVIYPPHVQSKGTFFGVAEVHPGVSPHRWHTHVSDKAEGYSVEYPHDFEEIYYIIGGNGVVQWKEDGEIKEEKVGPGDTVFFPVGVGEHQLFNNGKDKIIMVFCGSPTPKVTVNR